MITMPNSKSGVSIEKKLKVQIKMLQDELAEANETLSAIQHGEVDALLTKDKNGAPIFVLKNADQFYRILIENMKEGAVTLTSDGTIFYCNNRFSEYMTIPTDLLIGTSIFSFIKPEELNRFKKVFSSGRSSKSCSDDFTFELAAGKTIPLRITMSSTQIEDKLGICMVATDLTQQIRQIEYEKVMAELHEAVQARDEFISLASHELKTPLTSLILLSQMQSRMITQNNPRAFEKKRASEVAEKMGAFSSKLNILVEAMLDVTKIQSGQMSLNKQRMDLGELTKTVLTRMSSMFLAAGCEQPKFKKTILFGHWDPMRLEQVLNNLLANAIKYGNLSAMEVTIESVKGSARLSVKDKGKGINKENQLKIFSRYERTIDVVGISGLGLGLFISKKIIEAHDGTIWVDSIDGDGSTFVFEIPLIS